MSVLYLPRYVYQLSKKSLKGRHIKCIVSDLAGTLGDSLCNAPKDALMDTFKNFDIQLTNEEVRQPTGRDKYSHIKAILAQETVIKKWSDEHKRFPNEEDIRTIFSKYQIHQVDLLANNKEYTKLLPWTFQTLKYLKNQYKLKYGITTGYEARMTSQVLESFREQGFTPDCHFSSDEIEHPRPFIDGIMANLNSLGFSPYDTIKLGDTPIDDEEGNNANCVTVLLAEHSNEMGNQLEKFNPEKIDQGAYIEALYKTRKILEQSGADYVINNITELEDVIKDIHSQS